MNEVVNKSRKSQLESLNKDDAKRVVGFDHKSSRRSIISRLTKTSRRGSIHGLTSDKAKQNEDLEELGETQEEPQEIKEDSKD